MQDEFATRFMRLVDQRKEMSSEQLTDEFPDDSITESSDGEQL
jgi:hypothetical protein